MSLTDEVYLTSQEKSKLDQAFLVVSRFFHGSESLMKAVSYANYLSEKHNIMLQNKCLDFFRCHSESLGFRRKSQLDYLFSPNLPEFDVLNIKLLSIVLKCCLQIYSFQNSILSCDSFNDLVKIKIKLLRDNMGNYHSLHSKSESQIFEICQGIVANMVDKVLKTCNTKSKKLPNTNFSPSESETEIQIWKNSPNFQFNDEKLKRVDLSCDDKLNAEELENKYLSTFRMQLHKKKLKDTSNIFFNSNSNQHEKKINIEQMNFNVRNSYENTFSTTNSITNNYYNNPKESASNFKVENKSKLLNDLTGKSPSQFSQGFNFNDTWLVGKLKSFDEEHGYGFILVQTDEYRNMEIFVHRTQLEEIGLSSGILRNIKNGCEIRVKFQVVYYDSKKYGKRKSKAINLKLINSN